MENLTRVNWLGIAGTAIAVGVLAVQPTANASSPSTPAGTGGSSRVSASESGTSKGADDWTTYHYDQKRQGYDPRATTASGHLSTAWTSTLDGQVYAEPLVIGNTIIAVTENDSIYGLSLTGKVRWRTNVGTPVSLSELPCGNIDPLGITGTPVYDTTTKLVYFAAELDSPIRHRLYAVDPTSGDVSWSRNLDPKAMVPETQQERGALAIANGRVWVPFGGLAGDCGAYHGWVIGNKLSGKGKLSVYQQPSAREAGIWAPSGPAVDTSGHLYVAIGNGAATAPPYDDSDSIMKLDGNKKLSLFAPENWAQENAQDLDLGSTGPLLFNALGSEWVFGVGKAGDGYLLHQGQLGGIGGYATSISGCKSWGGLAFHAGVIYLPCLNGLSAVQVQSGPTLTKVWTNSAIQYGASPVMGGGAIWAIYDGTLFEVDPSDGSTVTTISVGSSPHFATPTLHGSLVLVGTTTGVTAVTTS